MEFLFQERINKIEKAFKKFDLNGDGYLSWEEFSKVSLRDAA
jgi:Ca2+-binding EF-hand superfamily protein